MADIQNHVRVTISRASSGPSRRGFGVPLYLSALASWASDRIRYYSSLAAGAVDFSVTTSPEYLFLQQTFAQNPRPRRAGIARTATARRPTMAYLLEVVAVRNSYAYQIGVAGKGFADTVLTVTSDSSATNDEIVDAIVTALNGVSGNNYLAATTGSAGSLDITVTGDAAGDWFVLEVLNRADLKITQTHSDPGVATDLAEILVIDKDWYALVTGYNSDAYVKAAAAWIESNDRIYIADMNDTDIVTTAAGSGDTFDDLQALNYTRTGGMFHHKLQQFPAAAWFGRVLPRDPGSIVFHDKELAGVEATTLTDTERLNLTNKDANGYEDIGGVGVTFEGKRFDGDYLDVTRDLDKLVDAMRTNVFTAKVGVDKVPFTLEGFSMIKAPIMGTLREMVRDGVLAAQPEPQVLMPDMEDIDPADKADRILDNVEWTGTLAGGIREIDIDGNVAL